MVPPARPGLAETRALPDRVETLAQRVHREKLEVLAQLEA